MQNSYSNLRAAAIDLFNNYDEFKELLDDARELKKQYPHFTYVDCIECAVDDFERKQEKEEYFDEAAEHGTYSIGGINF